MHLNGHPWSLRNEWHPEVSTGANLCRARCFVGGALKAAKSRLAQIETCRATIRWYRLCVAGNFYICFTHQYLAWLEVGATTKVVPTTCFVVCVDMTTKSVFAQISARLLTIKSYRIGVARLFDLGLANYWFARLKWRAKIKIIHTGNLYPLAPRSSTPQ